MGGRTVWISRPWYASGERSKKMDAEERFDQEDEQQKREY